MSEQGLLAQVASVLSAPPSAPADSFVLHAPLELMARAELLRSVDPDQREPARRRIADIAAEWSHRAPHVVMPSQRPAVPLPDAVAAGDIDAADRALVDLAGRQSTDEFVAAAGDALLSHLGGAGHLCIFLDQLTRWRGDHSSMITAGRALIRDLARHPDRRLRWIDDPATEGRRPTHTFASVLVNPPSGDAGSDSINPTMQFVDANGMAAELLDEPASRLSVDEARRQLLRVAAMSMLQDDPTCAPSGWTHCLTMPQATLAIAPRTTDPPRAIAIAATYVLGFRVTQSNAAIDVDWRPARPEHRSRLLDADVDTAVALAWHAEEPGAVERELATYAATHHDAHLAKYTIACQHAATDDPGAAPLYRAAATRLALWWRDHDATRTRPVTTDARVG